MLVPSHANAFEVLCLQAADNGRGPVLFGDSVARARTALRSFMIGEEFPSCYLEFPLLGDPFLDVTVLYHDLDPSMRIDSPVVAGTEDTFAWLAKTCSEVEGVSWGFEVDTSKDELPAAAMHFQPRTHNELVRPFFEVLGEPERADLYLGLAKRMPEGWPLSFFGLFRGRPGFPLRVCGYIAAYEEKACQNPRHMAEVFDAVGFTAYDDAMLAQISALMGMGCTLDFQFDVYPDGSLGNVFALDLQFGIEQSEQVLKTFDTGLGAKVMSQLEAWQIADGRWRQAAEAAFTRGIPAFKEDGTPVRFGFTLLPQWVKVRWKDGVLQPSKLYYLGSAKAFEV